jgi:hypothetical protein
MSTSDTKTDDSKLVTTDTLYVSPDRGDTDEAFPKPNVEYDFCVDVTDAGELPSGLFFVQFTLSGDQDPPKDLDFAQDAGLDAGAKVKAVVHFGTFPNQFASYHLEACIYSSSAPEKPINCAGSFDITINTESTSDSGSGGSNDDTSAADPTDSGEDSKSTKSQ